MVAGIDSGGVAGEAGHQRGQFQTAEEGGEPAAELKNGLQNLVGVKGSRTQGGAREVMIEQIEVGLADNAPGRGEGRLQGGHLEEKVVDGGRGTGSVVHETTPGAAPARPAGPGPQ